MMPRNHELPSDLTATQAFSLERIVTSKDAPVAGLVEVAPAATVDIVCDG